MEDDAFVINRSGKLGSLSYNMGYIVGCINAQDQYEDVIYLREKLMLKINEFDDVLKTLNGIKNQMGHSQTIDSIEMAFYKWEEIYKPLFLKIYNNENVNEICIRLNEEIDAYVNEIDNMIALYEAHSVEKILFALKLNAAFVFVIILVTIYSFRTSNKRIRKPIDILLHELKDLDFLDKETALKFQEISKDELTEMSRYFNEMMYDRLTKAFTRGTGIAKLKSILQQDNRRFILLSVCFLDINGLKAVNDRLGHRYGDELIMTVVDCIKREIREGDFVIRMGGDEFLIVLNGINADASENVWKRIEKRYQNINENENRPYIISVSHGIEEYDSVKKTDLEDLIKIADAKMYEEKRYIKEVLGVKTIRKDLDNNKGNVE